MAILSKLSKLFIGRLTREAVILVAQVSSQRYKKLRLFNILSPSLSLPHPPLISSKSLNSNFELHFGACFLLLPL